MRDRDQSLPEAGGMKNETGCCCGNTPVCEKPETLTMVLEENHKRSCEAIELSADILTILRGPAPEQNACMDDFVPVGEGGAYPQNGFEEGYPKILSSMDDFRADVAASVSGKTEQPSPLEQAVEKLAAEGIIDSPDYWKAGNYSAATVEKLLVKMAAAL